MAKKKPRPIRSKSRVSPPIKATPPKYTQYDALHNGDAFLRGGGLFMKCDNCEQEAIDLDTGYIQTDMCEEIVEPVDIQITWKKK